MNDTINIGMSEIGYTTDNAILKIVGLGSCVALAVFDINSCFSALAHIMLPKSNRPNTTGSPGKFADTAINYIIGTAISQGIELVNLRAKMAGGSCMFQKVQKEKLNIGEKNILSIRNLLKTVNIPLLREDTGGSHGRTIEFHADNKLFLIKSHRFGNMSI